MRKSHTQEIIIGDKSVGIMKKSKLKKNTCLIVEIFVDDIIFGGNDLLCKYFVDQMSKEFEMTMCGEIKIFICLQVHKINRGIYMT